jgi:hypothetical protein
MENAVYWRKLYSPPVGELDEEKPPSDLVDPGFILFLIVVDTDIKNRSGSQFVTQEKAGVDGFIVVVVIRYQPQS